MHVFISYAREDRVYAARLANALDDAGIPHWIDVKALHPGQDWEREITLALKAATHVVLLLSSQSVSKRGFVQAEVKEAIQHLRRIPAGQVFIVPVRIDACKPEDLELQKLNWFDLFPDIDAGMARLVAYLRDIVPATSTSVAEGRDAAPTVLAPYNDVGEVLRVFLSQFPRSFFGSSPVAYYLEVDPKHEGVALPPAILARFPHQVPLVLQHQYANLTAGPTGIAVDLWFSGESFRVEAPYEAIISITSPQLGLRITRKWQPNTASQ